ncbi:MAG: NifU family protein [Candidatus Velthaea sp.]
MIDTLTPTPSVQQMADRVESLLESFESVATPRMARENAEALVQTLVTLYGAGLERVLTIMDDTLGGKSQDMFAKLCADPFVESLLVLHDLHPFSLADRVRMALDSVRPYLESHEGGIEIVGIENGVAILHMEGSCEGCPSSAATVKLAVERAILERVPEIREVRADNVTAPAKAVPTLRIESDWIPLDSLAGLSDRRLSPRRVSGVPVIFTRVDDTIFAYRNTCSSCAGPLDDARVDAALVRCIHCSAAYDIVRAGRAADGGHTHLEPFPLVRENGRLRIALPAGT